MIRKAQKSDDQQQTHEHDTANKHLEDYPLFFIFIFFGEND
jgi:hypothetical protein